MHHPDLLHDLAALRQRDEVLASRARRLLGSAARHRARPRRCRQAVAALLVRVAARLADAPAIAVPHRPDPPGLAHRA